MSENNAEAIPNHSSDTEESSMPTTYDDTDTEIDIDTDPDVDTDDTDDADDADADASTDTPHEEIATEDFMSERDKAKSKRKAAKAAKPKAAKSKATKSKDAKPKAARPKAAKAAKPKVTKPKTKAAVSLADLPKRVKYECQIGMRASEEEREELIRRCKAEGYTSLSNCVRVALGFEPLR